MQGERNDIEFNVNMIFAEELIKQLQGKYPVCSIDNWQGYLLKRLSMMIQNYTTFSKLLEEGDFVAANAILRMLADHLAIIKLIYVDEEGEMRKLRHYLFLLDGSLTYLRITDSMDDYDNLIRNQREKCEEEILFIKDRIVQLPLYQGRSKEVENLYLNKRNCNWKYRVLSESMKGKDNVYSFSDLYEKLGVAPNIVAYLNYLSQFAHGLSLCSLGTVASIQNKPFLIEMRNLLLGLLVGYIPQIFPIQYNKESIIEMLRTRLTHSEMEYFYEIAYKFNS